MGDYVWFNRGGLAILTNGVHPVGLKKPNGLGLYDMCGNVTEYVSDWYDDKYYANSTKDNPRGPNTGSDKVIRGGSYDKYYMQTRTTCRDRISKSSISSIGGENGFRLVMEAK